MTGSEISIELIESQLERQFEVAAGSLRQKPVRSISPEARARSFLFFFALRVGYGIKQVAVEFNTTDTTIRKHHERWQSVLSDKEGELYNRLADIAHDAGLENLLEP